MTAPKPRRVVLAPDLIGAAFIDLHSRRVLERWRDGELMPVTNRDLFAQQLRTLRRLGLSTENLKRWAYWLASTERNIFIEKNLPSTNSVAALCEAVARAAAAEMIVCWRLPSRRTALAWTQSRVLSENMTKECSLKWPQHVVASRFPIATTGCGHLSQVHSHTKCV